MTNCTCKDPCLRVKPLPDGGYRVECLTCGMVTDVPAFDASHINELPRWFYWVAYGLGIVTALAFLTVLIHEMIRRA